ncbi:unnamed protein product [Paramecium primaurelia]|uniref:Uncharacterized protein n=1 Tax=Paramecium primaurelia TaxID=5886 RepID=A0A8S1QG63_PARPR|nr:unnamed protein product [Paramecium primaurelia]CAD8114969.1 unnamed protein product [Paramecium primaurelia]
MTSSVQQSSIIKRSTFLNQSQAFTITSRNSSAIKNNDDKKELRRYPTEWVEQIDNKSDNRYHHTILNKSKEDHNSNLASPSKIFENQDGNNPSRFHTQNNEMLSAFRRKNQSLGNLGNWQFQSPSTKSTVKDNRKTITHSFSKRLDLAIPLSELLEISRLLDCSKPDEIKQLSRGYVNELFQMSQKIERALKNINR